MKTFLIGLFFYLFSFTLFAQRTMTEDTTKLIIQVDSCQYGLAHGWGHIFKFNVIKTIEGMWKEEKKIKLTINVGNEDMVEFFTSLKPQDKIKLEFLKALDPEELYKKSIAQGDTTSLKFLEGQKNWNYYSGMGHSANNYNEQWFLVNYEKIE